MKISTMKFMDETFGPILCFFFYIYNKIINIFRKEREIDPQKVKTILLIKFFGMGSIILAGPLMRGLRAKFPHARIIVMTFSSNLELSKRIDLIDEVVAVDSSGLGRLIKSMLNAIYHLRKEKCDISLDLEFFAKSSSIIQYLCGVPVRLGYYITQQGILLRMLWRGDLLTHNVYYNPHRHTSDVFLALGRSIGVDTDDMRPARITVEDSERNQLDNLLSGTGIQPGGNLVVMNINASHLCLERRWPIDRFVQLAQMLLKNNTCRILLIGDNSDVIYVNQFLDMINNDARVASLAGRLNIGMLAALLAKAKVFITNDSGPLHIAVSANTPTVSLFGPEIPERYGPIMGNHYVLYSRVYCSPCLNAYNQKIAPCKGNNICMQAIAVDDVYKAAAARLR